MTRSITDATQHSADAAAATRAVTGTLFATGNCQASFDNLGCGAARTGTRQLPATSAHDRDGLVNPLVSLAERARFEADGGDVGTA